MLQWNAKNPTKQKFKSNLIGQSDDEDNDDVFDKPKNDFSSKVYNQKTFD